jgi:hypothetical protein
MDAAGPAGFGCVHLPDIRMTFDNINNNFVKIRPLTL